MPKLADDPASDADSDAEVETFTDAAPTTADTGAKAQLNGELQDDADEATTAAKVESDDEDDNDNDDSDQETDEYVVEAIRSHTYIKNKLVYEIKWVGYPEEENTYEPESNLLPHARDILARYRESLDEPPPPTLKKTKSKQSLRQQNSVEDSPAPPAKRQKRNGSLSAATAAEETWTPTKEDWEPSVVRVDAVEKDESGQLLAYILFKNNKKTKVSMDKVYRHCPRPMLRYYEEHLKFN